jgi:RHS repeat-associated protein
MATDWEGGGSLPPPRLAGRWDTAKPGAMGSENFDITLDLNSVNAVTQRRMYGAGFDEPIARQDANGAVTWYGADRLGSVRQVFDNTGTVTGSRSYAGFGAVTTTSGTGLDRYAFTGAGTDPLTGLVGDNARQYDPGLGRWTSEDPLGFGAGDANLNRYVGNGPTNGRDPSGMQAPKPGQGPGVNTMPRPGEPPRLLLKGNRTFNADGTKLFEYMMKSGLAKIGEEGLYVTNRVSYEEEKKMREYLENNTIRTPNSGCEIVDAVALMTPGLKLSLATMMSLTELPYQITQAVLDNLPGAVVGTAIFGGIYAGSHFFGVGFLADAFIIGIVLYKTSQDVPEIKELFDRAGKLAANAKTDADLREACNRSRPSVVSGWLV